MFGSHLSIAGGMHKALLEAERLGMTTTQVFTNSRTQRLVEVLQPTRKSISFFAPDFRAAARFGANLFPIELNDAENHTISRQFLRLDNPDG